MFDYGDGALDYTSAIEQGFYDSSWDANFYGNLNLDNQSFDWTTDTNLGGAGEGYYTDDWGVGSDASGDVSGSSGFLSSIEQTPYTQAPAPVLNLDTKYTGQVEKEESPFSFLYKQLLTKDSTWSPQAQSTVLGSMFSAAAGGLTTYFAAKNKKQADELAAKNRSEDKAILADNTAYARQQDAIRAQENKELLAWKAEQARLDRENSMAMTMARSSSSSSTNAATGGASSVNAGLLG